MKNMLGRLRNLKQVTRFASINPTDKFNFNCVLRLFHSGYVHELLESMCREAVKVCRHGRGCCLPDVRPNVH